MSLSPKRPAKDIFLQAVAIQSSNERLAFLARACADDSGLRNQVDRLIDAHERQESLLDRAAPALSAAGFAPTVSKVDREQPGSVIGPYRIREQIGEGGMGVVYVAEQEKPLRRKVALKVIKPGMDSKSVLARFDAERNALALMNHPNIAKVLDAGTTDLGHPFFVMELIQGTPITEYCDHEKLSIAQRLELFTQICNAVQHAHQKGVIHRDLKPTNILITEIDGKAVPKVIDFGVVKALGANLTDRTIYTNFQSLVGTPLYMSPEQAQLSGVDVDTRSDVYSLGILLYELLTGTTPLDPQELRAAAQDEVLRRIRETDSPRPSNRISSLGATSSQVSEHRGTQPEKLGRQVRGDLDWIVMKSLEKDRNRRYKTADALAADIGRHLASEPVEARPPSPAYRLSRFYQRNKVAVTFAAILLTLLAIAVPVTVMGWIKAEQYASDLRREFLGQAITEVFSGDTARAATAIQKAKNFGVDNDTLVLLEALKSFYGGDPTSAKKIVQPLLDRNPQHVAALCVMIMSHMDADDPTAFFQYHSLLGKTQRPPASDLIANLLFAQVALSRDPELSFEITQGLVAEHPYWPTLRALHGSAMILRAVDMPDDPRRLEQIENGLQNLELANRMVPNNEFVMTEYLVGLTYGIELGDSLQDQRTPVWRLDIEELIEESSERNWKNRRFESYRVYYLASMSGGDVPELREELLLRDNSVRSLIMRALRFYGENNLPAFSNEVISSASREAKLIGSFLEIEQSQYPKETARLVCDRLFPSTMNESLEWHFVAVKLLLFAGDSEGAREYASKALAHAPVYADRWTLRTMEYLANPTLERKREVTARAGPFSVPQALTESIFGMEAFAAGNRHMAMAHFENSVATGKIDWFSCCIADAMLRRMKSSNEWPSWSRWNHEPESDDKV